jgi:hypothetical protein
MKRPKWLKDWAQPISKATIRRILAEYEMRIEEGCQRMHVRNKEEEEYHFETPAEFALRSKAWERDLERFRAYAVHILETADLPEDRDATS